MDASSRHRWLLAGFPVALVLAWAFDIGPHGFENAAAAGLAEDCPPALAPRRRNVYLRATIGLVLVAVAGFFLLPRHSDTPLEKSIAVLPFDNFGGDKENEHFADGIQDDVLTSLAKIRDLKVISRTSLMPYKGKARKMKEIGRALGVSALLEGSVRRVGNRVRVNVQLINAATDAHLWAEAYERELTDVFTIQSALAQEIASQLQAKLSPAEKARIGERPTQNGDAYLLYVEAQAIATSADTEKHKRAEPLFQQAIALDPEFALAYAQLSRLHSWLYSRSILRRSGWRKQEPPCVKRFVSNQSCRKSGSHRASSIITASGITRRRCASLPRRGKDCLTSRRSSAQSRRSSVGHGKWKESTAH